MTSLPEYVQFWIVLITVPNLIVIALMVVVFALLVLLPLPRHEEVARAAETPGASLGPEQERGA